MKIELQEISKTFGKDQILDKVSLSFEKGKFYGLLGPNGSGKSTTVNIMIRLLKADGGKVVYYKDDGTVMTKEEEKKSIGVVFQYGVLDPFLTVKENLISRTTMYGYSKTEAEKIINEINTYLPIDYLYKKKYDYLSGGQKRKVDIARALVHNPDLLILDEPTAGIDVEIRKDLWNAIHNIRKKKNITIILISHYLEEMLASDWLYVLFNKGIQYSGTLNDFIVKNERSFLNLVYGDGNKEKIIEEFNAIIKNKEDFIEANSNEINVYYQNEEQKRALMDALLKKNLITDFYSTRPTLDSAYLQILNKGTGKVTKGKDMQEVINENIKGEEK
jgi:multidrug/hemolysin transport system ATP-binding protein